MMRLAADTFSMPIRVSPPMALPVSLAEARAQCRLTDDDDADRDALLMMYVRSAVEYLENYAGLALITQTIKQVFPWFGNRLHLARRPVRSITSIEYIDNSWMLQTVDTTVYRLIGSGADLTPASVGLIGSQSWPAVATLGETPIDEAITVTYVAGFGDDHNAVPESIRHAILMLAAYYFGQAEAALIDPQILEVPFGICALLDPWRLPAVA